MHPVAVIFENFMVKFSYLWRKFEKSGGLSSPGTFHP